MRDKRYKEKMVEAICAELRKGPRTAKDITKHLSENGFKESAALGRTSNILRALEAEGRVQKDDRPRTTVWSWNERAPIRDVCWYCGGKLIWDSDSDLEDEAGIESFLHCKDCGADVQYTKREDDRDGR